MNRLFTALAVLACCALFAPIASAQCEKSCGFDKTVANADGSKLGKLNASWKEALASAQSMDADQRQELHQRMATLKDSCPVGSRMGDTFASINGTLAMIAACCQADSECCASKAGSAADAGMDPKAFAEMKELVAARTSTIANLRELSGYMALCTSSKSSCDSAKSGDSAAAQSGDAVAAAACTTACPIELASNLGALKASWATARTEVLAMTAEQKQQIADGMASMGKDCQIVNLVPQTVFAVTEGLDKLNGIHTKMMEWGKNNAEAMASMPKDKMQSFYMQVGLTKEAHGVLTGMCNAMQSFGECSTEKTQCPSAGQTKEAAQAN